MLLALGAKAQEKSLGPATSSEWYLFLKTEGVPWSKKFEVTLDQTGTLNVTVQDPDKKPPSATTKVVVKLLAKDAQDIYDQTLKAFHEFQFPKEVADGTSLTLRLTVGSPKHAEAPQWVPAPATLSMQIFHFGQEEIPEVAKLLALLNKHLAEEHQIY